MAEHPGRPGARAPAVGADDLLLLVDVAGDHTGRLAPSRRGGDTLGAAGAGTRQTQDETPTTGRPAAGVLSADGASNGRRRS